MMISEDTAETTDYEAEYVVIDWDADAAIQVGITSVSRSNVDTPGLTLTETACIISTRTDHCSRSLVRR